jgi:elongation factor Tu
LRIVLLGAAGAGKSKVLDAIAHAAGVPVTSIGSTRSITTTTATGVHEIVDASADVVPSILGHDAPATVLVVSAADGALPATRAHVEAARHAAAPLALIVLDDTMVEDVELTDLVEMEIRELATKYEMNGDALPVVRLRPSRATHSSSPIPAIANALDAHARVRG